MLLCIPWETDFILKRLQKEIQARGEMWWFCASFHLESPHSHNMQLPPCTVCILSLEGSISERAVARCLAARQARSGQQTKRSCSAAHQAARAPPLQSEPGEEEEEQDSSCTCSHKSSLFTSLGNSHGSKFRGSLNGAKLAPAGEERKLLVKKKKNLEKMAKSH